MLLRYLDHFRADLLAGLEGLPEEQLMTSLLPSGWTPLGLLKHLICTEERWLVYRFEGGDLENPFADLGDAGWEAAPGDTLPLLRESLAQQAIRTRALVEGTDLRATGQPSDRWRGGSPATLQRLLLHLLQEYARHLGHLDVVIELGTGATATS